ncbi:MAG: hypothetical protein GTN89_11995 [Acidobacteria bacterium]|nr:hypothetical protein [Acidobacteriota bacterium]NIM61026.1 hypothetical protein [Acidobacteriota bacterium]NIO59994.1 hypothetical protein [Acidobacteriota bacterium]NIQ31066.1 hypothetical protein [Acidobacteriota bacterium]NIQ86194.1 hypothetical protein [Acidobacteriota bacterium]
MTAADGNGGDRGVRRTLLSVFLGWLVPGFGHVMLGRVRRGVFFGVLLWASFGFGMAHDARLSLRDDKQPLLTGLQVVANLGMGPIDPIVRLFVYGEITYSMTAGDNAVQRVEKFRARERSPLSIYGTAYVWTAGLMNLLLLFDIWDIGRGRRGDA